MSISLKNIAMNCLGVTPSFSVLNDIFGYFFHPGQSLSLKRQLELCRGKGLNINMILVGDDDFDWDDWRKTQYAIQFMREIYANVNLGVRKIRWQVIHSANAGAFATINSSAEAHDLTDDWNGPNGNHLDVFVVRSMTHADGVSAVEGPCSKDDKDEMTGSVVSLNGSDDNAGNTFAHEIAHYLSLEHVADVNNFIGNDGASNANTGVFNWQGNDMKNHCYVKDVC